MLIFQALILLNERSWKILTRKLLPWQKHQELRNSYSLNFLDAKIIIYSDLTHIAAVFDEKLKDS